MTSPWRLAFTALAAGFLGASAQAHGAPPGAGEPASDPPSDPPSDAVETPKVKAKLLAERPVLVPGKAAMLGLLFTIERDWHIYSNAISDSGSPPWAEWTLPPGFKVQPTLWPPPVRHRLPGDLLDHVYEKELLLLVPILVPADAKPGTTVTLTAELSWMVCKDLCLMEGQSVSIELPVEGQDAAQVVPDPKFSAARAKLPKPVALGKGSEGERLGIAAAWSDATLKIQVKGAKALTFYPLDDSAPPVNILADGTAPGETLTIRFDLRGVGQSAKSAPVHGVLEIKRSVPGAPETGVVFYELSIPSPAGH